MFKKLKQWAITAFDKFRTALKDEWRPNDEQRAIAALNARTGRTRKWPRWRIRQVIEARKHGTSKHFAQRGTPGAFGMSRANREAKGMPTTRKEQQRLGWYLPELPDENA